MKIAENQEFMRFYSYIVLRCVTSFRRSFSSTHALPKRMFSSSALRLITAPFPSLDHLKCPFSSRLKCSQNPSPSHSKILSLSRLRLQNTNSSLTKGSSWKHPSTMATSPLMLLRISVCPQARYTGISKNLIITFSAPDIFHVAISSLFLLSPVSGHIISHLWRLSNWYEILWMSGLAKG